MARYRPPRTGLRGPVIPAVNRPRPIPAQPPASMTYDRFVQLHGGEPSSHLQAAYQARFGARPTPALPPASAYPAPPERPAGLPDFAARQLNYLKAQQGHAEQVSQGVAGWLAQALAPFNQTAASVNQALAGGATNPIPTALPTVTGMEGGAVSDPNAYATQAGAQGQGIVAPAMAQAASARAALGAGGLNALTQGLVAGAGQRVQDLPGVFAKQTNDYLDKIGSFLEQRRQWAIGRADQERQRQFDRSITAQTLGLNVAKANQPADVQGAPPNADGSPPTAPTGYVYVRNATGGYDLKTDPTYVKPPGAPKPDKRLDPVSLQKGHTRWKGTGTPNNQSGKYIQANDGTWWVQTAGGARGGKPKAGKPTSPNTAIRFFDQWWSGKVDTYGDPVGSPGWKDLVSGGTRTTGNALARFFRLIQPYGLSPDQDYAIAKRYFSDKDLKAYLKAHPDG